jgi:outer membrane lipoprotein SlyB
MNSAARRYSFTAAVAVTVLALMVAGCATQGPVLYPNDHLKKVGEQQARKDIEECDNAAAAYVKSDAGKKAAKSTLGGAAVGTAAGTVSGAVFGNVGRGSLAGAATGATIGLIRGVSKASQPSPIHKRFVDQCLIDKGYKPIGWE